MGVKRQCIDEITDIMLQIDPTLDKDEVQEIVTGIFREKLKDPSINMDNNVNGENWDCTLTELCNWIEKRNPVVSGNATFYVQPTVMQSPTSNMLRQMKARRKAVKNHMFKLDPKSDEYQRLDLEQNNLKVIMNAEYGGSGAPEAAFYTKYSPPATTLLAQSVITTMAAFFESYIGDNQKFFHINECFDWMERCLMKKDKIPNSIYHPSVKEVSDRIKMHFYEADINDFPVLDKFLENRSPNELAYLYYANNINGLVGLNEKPRKILRNIISALPVYEPSDKEIPDKFKQDFKDLKDYNKWVSHEMFFDPYSIPDVISKDMEDLRELMTQFVYVEYITPDSIMKLNNHKRNTVLLVDTDSNVINVNRFVTMVLDDVLHGDNFGRLRIYNDMICCNIIASMLSTSVALTLDYYGRCHHMDEEARKELAMKNEFMFRILFLMMKKKRYAASIALREGNIMMPFKLEIKGMDFIKAGVTDDVTNRFTDILKNRILSSDEIDPRGLMSDLKDFEDDIRSDLSHGGTKYLKTVQYKSEEAYKPVVDKETGEQKSGAWRQPAFRGACVWNELYPDQAIYSLDRVKLVKTVITGLTDIADLQKTDPEVYKILEEKIFNSPIADVRKSGVKVIAIPGHLKKMPDWLIRYIDYDIAVSDIMASFNSVPEALQTEKMISKTPNGKASIISCLISM